MADQGPPLPSLMYPYAPTTPPVATVCRSTPPATTCSSVHSQPTTCPSMLSLPTNCPSVLSLPTNIPDSQYFQSLQYMSCQPTPNPPASKYTQTQSVYQLSTPPSSACYEQRPLSNNLVKNDAKPLTQSWPVTQPNLVWTFDGQWNKYALERISCKSL